MSHRCCGGTSTTCAHCDAAPSDTMQIVLSGISNDDCALCAGLDGTYEVTRVADLFGCRWEYTFPGGSDCGVSLLTLQLSDFAAPGTVEVQLQFLYGGFNHFITWNTAIAFTGSWKIDCVFSSLLLSFVSVTGPGLHPCAGVGSTATLTSL